MSDLNTNQPDLPRPDGPRASTDRLIKQYIEDRDSLSPEELDQLIDVLREQPKLAIEVRTQLLVDDLLAQKLAVDRRNFLAQVGQRIGDFEQGEEEIYSQVSDLRALAEAELHEAKARRSSPWAMAGVTALALSLAVVAFLLPQYWPISPRAVATVQDVSGNVVVVKGGQRLPVQVGDTISTGTPLEVATGSLVRLQYVDKTLVQFGGDSKFELIADRKSKAKNVRMQQGEALASVQPQRDVGPMVFQTPQARAIVLGTEFRLIVSALETRLDVTEGKVEFVRNIGGAPAFVTAHQSAVADQQSLVLRKLQWPDDPSRLIYSLQGEEHIPLVRKPQEKNKVIESEFTTRGPVQFVKGVNVYNLNGGSFVSEDVVTELLANLREGGPFTIEAIVMPDGVYGVKEARVLSFGDNGSEPNFHLVQTGSQLIFRLGTSLGEQELKLGSVKADRAVLVTVTYDGAMLKGYLNGKPAAAVSGVRGNFKGWNTAAFCLGADAHGQHPWRGTICDLAISEGALAEFEVARSSGQYQALFARRDAGLSWDNLMSDNLDPSQFEGSGNWQLTSSGWENGVADEAWFALGPGGLKSYDLLVDVKLMDGEGPLEMAFPVADRPVKVVLGKSGSEQKTALQDMGGSPMPGAVSISNDRPLPVGRAARLEVQVRAHKDEASLAVSFDGEPLVDWKGSLTDLPTAKQSGTIPVSTKPVLVTGGSKVRIEALKIRDVGRTASSAIGQ